MASLFFGSQHYPTPFLSPPPSLPFLLSLPKAKANSRRLSLPARAADDSPGSPTEPSAPPPPAEKPNQPSGFGDAATPKSKRKAKPKGPVVRRSPVEPPSALYGSQERRPEPQQETNEGAFLLTWLGLGCLILVEGIALAASGFLPEEWDNFFVKYLYPSFTPTVFLFVAGTVAYGVFKYLQGEKTKS